MKEMKVKLQGLTCAHCAGRIETVLSEEEGTKAVSINLMKQEMKLSYQDSVSEKGMQEIVKKTVYRFEPEVEVLFENKVADCYAEADSCCCYGHHHGEEKENGKGLIFRFSLGLALFLTALLWQEDAWKLFLFLGAYLVFGYDVLLRAIRNIGGGQVFDENFLMSVATIGALWLGETAEAVFVMLFYQVGEAFQEYALVRSRKSITALLDIRPDFARVVLDGKEMEKNPEQAQVGDLILVKAGERIPLDGTVVDGAAFLDTATLTGESLPRQAEAGSFVHSGCINLDGSLYIRVEKPFGESTVMKILELVENAAGKKSKTEKFITRFARIYTPVVCLLAVLVTILPPVIGMGSFSPWFGRALVFLVVSCPCALVLSIPLGYFSGIGAASSRGILVKGGNDLDLLAEIEQIVFDKTGTLTEGQFFVTEEKGDVLRLAAIGESMSNHPVAQAIREAYGKACPVPEQYQELGGYGISYMLDGERILLGNGRLMKREQIPYETAEGTGTVVYVAKGGRFLGYILVSDRLKEKIGEALEELRKQGIQKIVMLTGDRQKAAEAVAQELRLDEYYSELLPEDKLKWMEHLQQNGQKTAFVGDGINDAPVLAGADLGIAMGGIGSDAAIEAADVVLMEDDIAKLAVGIRIARNTGKIVRQNIVFALGCKVLVLLLSVFGMASLWMAVFADVGVCVLAILNSMRKKD